MIRKKGQVFSAITGYFLSFVACANYYQADAALIDVNKRAKSINSSVSSTQFPGEHINLVTREVGWDVVDLSIPGQGPVIEISRRHATTTPGWFDNWRREMYNWELSIPRVDVALWTSGEHRDVERDILYGCGYGNVRSLDVRIRDGGDFKLIAQNSDITYPVGTHAAFNNNWIIKCKQAVTTKSESRNLSGGMLPKDVSDALVLISPEGMTYTFAYRSTEKKVLPPMPAKTHESWASWSQMVHTVYSFYITDIEDRFGNYVSFHYEERVDNNNGTLLRLKEIKASDGRLVTLEYQVDAHGTTGVNNSGRHLKKVVAGVQSVEYTYAESDNKVPQLKSVKDGSARAWTYNYHEGSYTQNSLLKDISTPWGAKISYSYKTDSTRGACRHWIGGSTVGSVEKRTVNTGKETYVYEYSGSESTVGSMDAWVTNVKSASSNEKFYHACPNVALADTAPEHAKTLTLIKHEVFGGPAFDTLVRTTESTWNTIAYTGNARRNPTVELPVSTLRLYKQKQVITEDTGIYTTEWSLPDAYGLLTKTEKSSNQITEKQFTLQSYSHFPTAWLIGQPSTVSLSSDGLNWTQQSETTYYDIGHAYKAKPHKVKQYGHLLKTFSSYNTDGTLKRVDYNDGNQRWVQLEDYKLGVPQKVKLPQRYNASCINPDECSVQFEQLVDDNGWVTKTTDLNKNCINYSYDKVGRISTIEHCDTAFSKTIFSYEQQDTQTTVLETRGDYNKETTLDGLYREILTKEWDRNVPAEARVIRKTFNNANNPVFVSHPSQSVTETQGIAFEYDSLQRKVSESFTGSPTGKSWIYQLGNKITFVDDKGNSTSTTYKALGEPAFSLPLKIEQPKATNTTITYTLFDKISSITQGDVKEVRHYDNQQQLCLVKRPDTGISAYTYTSLGQVAAFAEGLVGKGEKCLDYTNVASAWHTNSYDNLGDLKSISYGDGSPVKAYKLDNQGNIEQLKSGPVVWDYSYNSTHQIESEILTVDSFSWKLDPSYNQLGHIESLTYPSNNKVTYAPNALGQPTKAGSYAKDAAYHANGALNTFTYGNNLTFTQTLNSKRQIEEKQTKSGQVTLAGQKYHYDANDNLERIIDIKDSSKNVTLGFDELDRLTVADGYWGKGTLSYDNLGNIKTKNLGSQALIYSYDSNNRLQSVSGGYNFSYDGRGTVTSNGKRSFTTNGAGHMLQSGAVSYLYDGHNRRVKKTNGSKVQYSIYNQAGQFLVTAGDNGTTEYVYLGNQLVAKVSQVATMEDKPGYTGHLEDKDIELTYMQARYYDPVIGRFYSNDPVDMLGHMQKGNPTMGFNRYAYANNNPYKYTDPDGRFVNFIVGGLVGAGIEAAVQYATTGEINTGEVIAAGAAGALTGGVGPMLANIAAKGTISAATAVAGTAATGSASSVAGKLATNAVDGKETTGKDVVTSAVGGAVGAGVGAKLSNSVASTLEKGFGGLNSSVANTTRSSMVGNTQAAATTSAYTEAGKLGADVATNVAQKEIEKQ